MRRFLVAESETPDERAARRAHTGQSSGETYADTLRQLDAGATIEICQPADVDAPVFTPDGLARYDAVFLTGSPLHVYDDTPEVRRQLAFMRAVFASGTPSFGSCAGLQVAIVAAGGSVRKMPQRMEAGFSRRIVATEAGRAHPLLAGRPATWDAPAVHGDEVETLPDGATLLAGNNVTRVQAVEIRHDKGVFWGVQYHPELSLGEIAIALRRQADGLIEAGLAEKEEEVAERADVIEALHHAPERRSLRWRLGVDGELADVDGRRREIVNFLASLPTIDRRGAR
ncbi:glutamine amidotransferase [Sphingomonas sp. Leaf231]|uniref:type 1 glutamine amidotransferase n=1 Tax=Sphingomonas sp. Leaf231 TaxID=1736301 RepID=UPI0006FDA139|nr:type 1 glutamine amidotransferase [Sphingomonas sp. Leaf231]KQN92982.1 glutamine amidotransferase [Sphingomonas sp. Leaf231]